jgi:opacity protein-like surface antigen
MKKLLICFVLWGVLSSPSQAQVVLNPNIGIAFSDLDASNDFLALEGSSALRVGIDFRVGNKDVFFQPGVHYLRQSVDVTAFGINAEGETRVQNLQVPLAAGLRITPRENMLALRGKAGIVPTFLLQLDESTELQLTKDDVAGYRTDVVVGMGLDIALLITLDVQYSFGLQDYLEEGDGSEGLLMVTAGIKFGRGNALYGR